MATRICYISVNEIWSGSEVLWSQSATQMIELGVSVSFFATYEHSRMELLESAGGRRFHLPVNPTLFRRTFKYFKRLLGQKIEENDPISTWLATTRPHIVVISQGNNMSGREMMRRCVMLNIPFVTVTQLVTEFSWLFIDDSTISVLHDLYKKAKSNYFVSENNLRLNNLMLSAPLTNAEVVYNPYRTISKIETTYPGTELYRVAIVGRLECMHKGLDLLMQILCFESWRKRNIHFTFYGNGPHYEWVSNFIKQHRLQNVVIAGHVDDVSQIWQSNHILLMPSRMEGQSLALVEAMYCKRCAIVTNVGGAGEIIEEGLTGFIAEFSNCEEINNAMERAWTLRDNWKKMGEDAAAVIKSKYPDDPIRFFNDKILAQVPVKHDA